MNARQTSSKYHSQPAVVAASSGLIALLTGGIFIPSVGVCFAGDLVGQFLGKEGMTSDMDAFDEDARRALKQATAKILAKAE